MKKLIALVLAAVMAAGSLAALPASAEKTENGEFDPSAAFVDVPADAWFREYVDFVASRGIMGGDGEADTFMPQNRSTRAMIAVILHRFEGRPAAGGPSPFTDITEDWYIPAVEWAYEAGVVKGTGAASFDPDAAVTRQELVTMLYRYASLRGLDVSPKAAIGSFPDASDVAPWANESVGWALGTGLVLGRNEGGTVYLAPGDFTPRCELATLLARFLPKFDAEEESDGDPLFRIAEKLNASDPCGEHGAALHIEMGPPADLTEAELCAAIIGALGLDPSIYDLTLGDGVFASFADSYSKAENGKFTTATVRFEIDNARTVDGPAAFDSIPVAFLRNDWYSSPRAVSCDTDGITDEALAAKLCEIGALYLCPAHGCVHLEAEDLSEDALSHAVAELMELDGDVYAVRPDGASFSALKSSFDGLGYGETTDATVELTVSNEAIEKECGYEASCPVSVNISAMKIASACRAVGCPYEKAERATELFDDKYVCREHGKTHIALNYAGPAKLSDIEALMTEVLDLGDGYTVALDAGAFAAGEIRTKITHSAGYAAEGPVFTPIYSVNTAMSEAAKFTLCENERDAYKLIVHDGYSGNTGYGSWNAGQTESGWLLDSRADYGVRHGQIRDVSTAESSQVIREVNPTSKGVLNFRTSVDIKNGFDGAILDFRNTDDLSVLKLETRDGVWGILGRDGSFSTLYDPAGQTKFVFDIKIDLYGESAGIVINDADLGLFPLAEAGVNVNIGSFRFASGKEETVTFDLGLCDASVNYGLWEYFADQHLSGTLPEGWRYENAYIVHNTGVTADAKLFDHYLGLGTAGRAEKSFEPTGGKTIVRFSILPAATGSDTVFTALGGGNALISVKTDETSFYVNGRRAYDYAKNVWYYFYLVCDTETGEVQLKINGIDRGEYSLTETGVPFDAVRVENGGEPLEYDAFFVYEDVYHSDYVPEPVKPDGEEEYTVGMNTCCMWQNGFHGGWACITPYDDIRPVLGYYDEGVPETADWEIKYMVEHGIDFQSFVLFSVEETGPVTTGLGMHLEDGYKYAKYNDMLDYCLIWCSITPSCPRDMDAWRDYYVPYLIENHFKDPHYLVLDNKPVLQFFRFIDSRESPYWTSERRKEAFDYLDEEVRKLGFDGMIYIIEEIKGNPVEEGIDGLYSYNQGKLCTTFENLKYYIEEHSNEAEYSGNLYYVPTSAIGFNCVGWMEDRTPLMTPGDFRKGVEWIRDEYLTEHNKWAPDWAKNLTIVCTWNEYGEGHYLMPCDGLHGFDYLDVLRETYTSEGADESLNLRPTEAQLERINRLYPQDLRLIRAQELGTYDNGVDDPVPLTGETYEWIDEICVESCVVGYDDNLTLEDGVICNDSSTQGYVTLRVDTDRDITKCSHAGVRIYVPERKIYMIFGGTGDHENFERFSSTSLVGSGTVEDVSFGILTDGTEQLVRIRLPAGAKLYSLKIAADVKTYFPYKLNVLGSMIDHKVLPEISPRGDYLFGFDTIFTDLHLFGSFAEWNDAEGVLRLSLPGGVFEFTVGSAFYTLNGQRYYLGYPVHKTDGVPMIPLNVITDFAGYGIDYSDIRNAAVYEK
ncbi:MAG: S-layer homology domain-containing protein [Clostridia bacterium]|nr:S-layer homology domain-containing protein [Clostridia bacterium]